MDCPKCYSNKQEWVCNGALLVCRSCGEVLDKRRELTREETLSYQLEDAQQELAAIQKYLEVECELAVLYQEAKKAGTDIKTIEKMFKICKMRLAYLRRELEVKNMAFHKALDNKCGNLKVCPANMSCDRCVEERVRVEVILDKK